MLRQTLQLLLVVIGVGVGTPAQAQQWRVSGDQTRDAKVLARYRTLLRKNPDQPVILRQLVARLGRGPGLDPLIADVRERATKSSEASAYVLLGHLLKTRGKPAEALTAYRTAVELGPDSASTHTALATALDTAGRSKEASLHFERALELSGSQAERGRLLRRLTDQALGGGDFRRAVQWMQQLVDQRPKSYALRIELAETLLRAQRFDESLGAYKAALALSGRSGKRRAETLVEIGSVERQLHDFVAAERSYRRALTLVGKTSWLRREILMRLVDVAREAHALPSIYAELAKEWSRPTYHDAMVLAGLCDELGRRADAVRWLERAARLDRNAVEPRTKLIAHLDHELDARRVRALFDEIVRLRPGDLPRRLERIEWLFFRQVKTDDAIAELRLLERQLKDDVDGLVEIAATWQRFGMHSEALRLHGALERTHADNVTHLEAYGELLTRLGRDDDAEVVWQRLFASDLGSVQARLRVAEVAARQKRTDHAIELLEWVVEREPGRIAVRQRLASLYETARRWPDALRQWEFLFFEHHVAHAGRRVVAIAQRTVFMGSRAVSPDDELLQRWEARYRETGSPRTGVVLAKLRDALLGGMGNGLEIVEKISASDPARLPLSQHPAWLEAAEMIVREYEDREPQRAIEMLVRVATAFGDRRVSSWRRAVDIALHLDDVEYATKVIERALAAAPNDSYVHAQAGVHFGALKQEDRAIAHLSRAVELGTRTFDVHFDLAFHLVQRGDTAKAREVFLEVLRRDWTGNWATSAAFSAIDLCTTDAQMYEVEREVRGLRGRLDVASFRAVVAAIYGELFLYASDRAGAFETLGVRALPLIVDALRSDASEDAERAAELLALYPGSKVVRAAQQSWPTPVKWSPEMVWAVARTRAATAAKSLMASLDSEDREVRELALFGLGLVRSGDSAVRLAKVLNDDDASSGERALAAAALGRIGTDSATANLSRAAAESRDPRLRVIATWALGQSDNSRSAEALALRLGDSAPRVGQVAGASLGQAGGDAALRALLASAWDAGPVRRAMAERGLRVARGRYDIWLDPLQPPSRPRLLVAEAVEDVLASEAVAPRAQAFVGREQVVIDVAREQLGRRPQLVLEQLVSIADEAEAGQLPSIQRVVLGLRPRLREYTRSSELTSVRSAALLLPFASRTEDVSLVVHAASVLPPADAARVTEQLGRYPWDAIREPVLDGVRSTERRTRLASLRALRRAPASAPDSDARTLVRGLVADGDVEIRRAAIEALGALHDTESVDILVAAHDAADVRIQGVIRTALTQMGTPESVKAAQRLRIRPTLPVCEGDPNDLSELLADDCVSLFKNSDF